MQPATILFCTLLALFQAPAQTPAQSSSPSLAKPNAASTQPTPRAEIPTLLGHLESASSQHREAAFRRLLGLTRDDLPDLLAAVKNTKGFSAGAISQLRRAVIHIYLSGEPYESAEGGALGIELEQLSIPGITNEDPERQGILVLVCRPGFAAYRYLEPGDVIVGIVGEERFDRENFGSIIKRTGTERPLTLQVIRRSKMLDITLMLSKRPPELNDPLGVMRAPLFPSDWIQRGEDYWQANFAPILGGDEQAGQP